MLGELKGGWAMEMPVGELRGSELGRAEGMLVGRQRRLRGERAGLVRWRGREVELGWGGR